jgi:hypothetical protein
VDNDVMMFAQVMTVIVCSTASFVAIALGGRMLWRVGSRKAAPTLTQATTDSVRLERLEHAVDSIAIEVERISEGQRFTVALLSERLPGRAEHVAESLAAGPRRMNTPH